MFGWFVCGGILLATVGFTLWKLNNTKPVPKTKFIPPRDLDWGRGQKKLEQALPAKTGEKYAIIGCGFLGKWLLYFLLKRGERGVVCADIVDPDLAEFLEEFGPDSVQYVKCDITDRESIRQVLRDVKVVFLTSALIVYHQRMHFQYPAPYRVNVNGTENVVMICKELAIRRIIYTSTSHVCVGKDVDQYGILDENTAYTLQPLDHYTKTKILAEKIVLNANSEGLRTVAVRPCSGIFGYRDKLLTEKFFAAKRCAPLVIDNAIDFVYVENVCLGHLLAEQGLNEKPSTVSGNVYCISNEQPMPGIQFYSLLCYLEPRIQLKVPSRKLLELIATLVEWLQWFRHQISGKWSLGDLELLTPPTLELTALSYQFSSNKARCDLGYEPAYTVEEGLQKIVDMYRSDD